MRQARLRVSGPAVGAQAEDGEMPDIGQESLILLKRRDERPDGGLVHLRHSFALAADQVHVLSVVLGEMVGRRPVMQVTVLDQAKLLEQLQGAVHG